MRGARSYESESGMYYADYSRYGVRVRKQIVLEPGGAAPFRIPAFTDYMLLAAPVLTSPETERSSVKRGNDRVVVADTNSVK